LHQVELLRILPVLANQVLVPEAVISEVREGLNRGVDLPNLAEIDWITVRKPTSALALNLVTDLGPGEAEVLALGLENRDAVVVLDDAMARRVASTLGLNLTGTLGLLLDAKRIGQIDSVALVLDQLESLRFRLSKDTRASVLALAGEVD
jgi:predicted nucleic acid-binding protein